MIIMLALVPVAVAFMLLGFWLDRRYVGCPLPRAVKLLIMPELATPPRLRRRPEDD
ncbi:MAG TPA: hypothetical protein VEI97_02865 [bacterium]|nr:hypothetical protein [bacterium]